MTIVAKQIIREVKAVEVDKSKYDIRLTEETLTETLSDTLMSLLSQLSPKLNRSNPAYMIGNIVSRYIRKFPTTLQIVLGVLMRDSKSLIQQLNEFGVTCSYDEVLQFKKSSAIAATEDIKLRAISDSKSSMIQTVVDNFDADISSQNGKLPTHALAVK